MYTHTNTTYIQLLNALLSGRRPRLPIRTCIYIYTYIYIHIYINIEKTTREAPLGRQRLGAIPQPRLDATRYSDGAPLAAAGRFVEHLFRFGVELEEAEASVDTQRLMSAPI
jgi:hypothetical protein